MLNFFKNSCKNYKFELNELHKWVLELENKYVEIEELRQKLYYKNVIIENMIEVSGGHIWRKDKDKRYLYCDNGWKELFFDLDSSFNIIGKTDKELLEEFRKDGKTHTYGDICSGTDDDCIQRNKKCHYIEMGYIGKQLFILDVIKTPTDDGGTVGFAKDISSEVNRTIKELSKLLKDKQAEIVFKKDNDVVAYYIKSESIYSTVVNKINFPE